MSFGRTQRRFYVGEYVFWQPQPWTVIGGPQRILCQIEKFEYTVRNRKITILRCVETGTKWRTDCPRLFELSNLELLAVASQD